MLFAGRISIPALDGFEYSPDFVRPVGHAQEFVVINREMQDALMHMVWLFSKLPVASPFTSSCCDRDASRQHDWLSRWPDHHH